MILGEEVEEEGEEGMEEVIMLTEERYRGDGGGR